MLTATGRTILVAAVVFCGAGVLFGNWPVFGAGALLAFLVSMTGLSRSPLVARSLEKPRIERGGRLRVDLVVEAPRGLGIVELHQALPEEFDLVRGSNFHVITLGWRKRRYAFTFEARAPKRGEWTLPPVGVRIIHPLGLSTGIASAQGEPVTIVVEPRALSTPIPRDMRARAKRPFPDGDLARMGLATNEFRELRDYVPGDPPRRINWKATARRMGSGWSDAPLVNETEFEGKKTVLILVDGHPRLSVGTNLEDAREHAADAALSLMEAYLKRGFQVALALARSGPVPLLRPGMGDAQITRARQTLAELRSAESPTFMDVIEHNRATLHRLRPLVVLITRASYDDADLRSAIRRLSAFTKSNGRNLVPGLLVDLEPPGFTGNAEASALALRALDNDRVALAAEARAANFRVTTWHLEREALERVLTRERVA